VLHPSDMCIKDRLFLVICCFGLWVGGAAFADRVQLDVIGGDETLETALRAASSTLKSDQGDEATARDLLATALSDYRTLLGTLYANGYYAPSIEILADGREVSGLSLLGPPPVVNRLSIRVRAGDRFSFGQVTITPVPEGFAPDGPEPGEIAESGRIMRSIQDVVTAWRANGHPKARVVDERVTANHTTSQLNVQIRIDPGPVARFGALTVEGQSDVRSDVIIRMAGLPVGERYTPDMLQSVATRLRRSSAFSSVALNEADQLDSDNRLDITVRVTDAKPRRFGFGAEISSAEGATLSGFWVHRNLLGGAERLRFDAALSNIGGPQGGMDAMLGARFEIPAAFGPDTKIFALAEYEHLDPLEFTSDRGVVGVGAERIFSDTLSGDLGVMFEYSETQDAFGTRDFTMITLPFNLVRDHRDSALRPTDGFYLALDTLPFLGLRETSSGVRTTLDMRGYQSLGQEDQITLAGRAQLGSVFGPSLSETRPDLLFFSGGGGTVRGQPYQSLGVDLSEGQSLGGRSFLGLSTEIRAAVTDQIGAVAFADAGYVGSASFYDGEGAWHAGAGLGVRYDTGLGPLRLDIAAPVAGDTGDGLQIYLGIGHAF
jgi:translocation and assembly module TamA